MKRARKTCPVLLRLALAACLLPLAWPLAQGAGVKPGYSTNAADETNCKVRLNIIYGALRQYREQHGGKLPDKLSDLTPEFIRNSDLLVCPYRLKQGGLRTWTKKLRQLAPDFYTSYSYEMPPEPMGPPYWRGLPMKTWREFKERQAEELGPEVPIVRCFEHRPRLNLAIGGRIYESEDNWESNFPNNERLSRPSLFRVPAPDRPLTNSDFSPRSPKAGARLLDLTTNYNATLTNAWQGFAGNDLASLPTGIQRFDGVEFDVRGAIQLGGGELPVAFPKRAGVIAVGQKCDRIHFLHAVSLTYQTNTVQGTYTIQYANGAVEEILLLYGQNIADWWREPGTPSAPEKATVAWTGQNKATKAYGMELCLYHAAWENPLKDVKITTISFSEPHSTGAFVVAITLD